MNSVRMAADRPCVAVFDLDGTLTWRDTLLPYLAGYLLNHPPRALRFWRLPAAIGAYASGHDRGLLKSRLIRTILGGEARTVVEAWSDRFVANLTQRGVFRPAALVALDAHRAAGDRLVLLSASPDLYVPRIGVLLGFECTVCTELEWWRSADGTERLDGTLRTANRRGEEKSRCLEALRARYTGLPVVAYGNSESDLPHMLQADRALLVNGDGAARRAATAAGIPLGNWS